MNERVIKLSVLYLEPGRCVNHTVYDWCRSVAKVGAPVAASDLHVVTKG